MQGRLLLFFMGCAFVTAVVFGLYPFLAQSDPLPRADLAIIEGWLDDDSLQVVLERVDPGTLLITTGGAVELGRALFKEKDYAELTAARLRAMGVPSQQILPAPAPHAPVDRTYTSAQAVHRLLQERNLLERPMNVYSFELHSRRSFWLYRRVFGPDAPLGIVSVKSERYAFERWWRSSLTFKQLVGELVSWLYTRTTSWKYEEGLAGEAL